MRSLIAAFALLAVAFSASLQARTVADEQHQLKQFVTKISELTQVNHDISDNISALTARLPAVRKGVDAARRDKDAADKVLDDLRKQAKAKPTEQAKSRVDNARFQAFLAQRKYNDAAGQLDQLQNQIARLKATLQSNRHKIDSTQAKIVDQRQLIARMQDSERRRAAQARQQVQSATAARQAATASQNDAAQREIQHLKALLARKEAAERAQAAADAAAVERAATAHTTTNTVAAQPTHAVAGKKPTPAAKQGPTLMLVTDPAGAARVQQQTAHLASSAENRGRRYSRILYVKHFTDAGKLASSDSHSLRYLGGNQYRGDARLDGGDYEFVIGPNHWRQTIAPGDRATYVFILDYRKPEQPHLVLFNEALTAH